MENENQQTQEQSQSITGITQQTTPSSQIDEQQVKDLFAKLKNLERIKEEFIGIFGLFAALLIFSSVEIRIFSTVTSFSLILGISSFFISSLMLFVLTLNNLIHTKDRRDYASAAFIIALCFFALS